MNSRLLLGWAVGGTLLLVQRPLFAPNLWWDLSRGREVASGAFTPCHELLSLDLTNEADWCSGVPFYFVWICGGIHFVSAVPLLVAAALLLFVRRRVSMIHGQAMLILMLPLFLWTMRDGLQPVPQLFDLLGLAALWHVVHCNMSSRGRLAALLLTFTVWGNLGPRPIWGLLWLLCMDTKARPGNVAPSTEPDGKDCATVVLGPLTLQSLIAALLGGMMTPRGLWSWRDSAILLCPTSFTNVGSYSESIWSGAFQSSPWTTAGWTFLPIWCLWVGMKFRNSDVSLFGRGDPRLFVGWRTFPRFLLAIAGTCVPLAMALLCQENLPICGLWILLDMMQPTDLQLSRVRVPTASRHRWGLAAMAIVVLCPVVIDASGCGLTPYRRLGWGIAQEIDPRLLDAQLLSVPAKRVIGWAPDERSVGLVAWLDGNVLMADHPQRALLGGRAPLHSALITDLLGAHRARYRRDDGTWGGWVRQMADWRVNLIFVPVEMQALHRELTKTTWRPLDLDSPAVPFVSADDARYSEAILEIMAQQGFVELGPWQPTVQIYNDQGWRFDAVEFFGGGVDPAAAIRQSQLFRSMDIPLASLRVLLPVRQQSRNRSLAEEFLACQNDLAYQEWTTFGEASYFRRLVVTALTGEQTTSEVPWLTLKSDEDSDGAEAWSNCVAFYLQGRTAEAVNALPLATSAQHFAAAMLWLELGESGHALKELEHLLSTSDHQAVLIAAKYWHQQVGQFGGP